MDHSQRELNELIDSEAVVLRPVRNTLPSLENRLKTLLASANLNYPPMRQVLEAELMEVAQRSFSKNFLLSSSQEIEFKVFREVNNFLEMATSGKHHSLAESHTDLLSAGHPLSTSPELESLSEEEIREIRAEWLSNDPRISEEFRPVVASGFMSEPNSVERRFIVTRLDNAESGLVPKDVVIAIADAE